jgi:iron complex outermembrane recepter protein
MARLISNIGGGVHSQTIGERRSAPNMGNIDMNHARRELTAHGALHQGTWAFVTVLLAALASFAQAQATSSEKKAATSSEAGLEEIVVTATRRETSAQNISIAITAIGSEQLQALGINSPLDLDKLVPNLYVTEGYGAGQARFSIRGLSVSDYSVAAVSPVALYIDDVYQAYTFGVGTSLFDLDRVEALRGPQGTLFGKNSTGGAIAYFAAAPTDKEEGYLDVNGGGGQFTHFAAEAVLNEPLIPDVLLSRLSFRATERGDYVENLYDGSSLGHNNQYSARFQLRWLAGPDTTVNLNMFGAYFAGSGVIYHGFNLTNVCNPALGLGPYFNCKNGVPAPSILSSSETSSEVPPWEDFTNGGATLHVTQKFADWTLSSITNYTHVYYQLRTNDDGTDADFFHSIQQTTMWQGSQEVRLASPADRKISAVVGAFAMYDSFVSPNTSISTEPGIPYDYAQIGDTNQDTTTYALFGSATWRFADQWSLIAGMRESSERKKINLAGLDLNSGAYALSNWNVYTPGAISNNTLLYMDPRNPPFQIYPNIGPPYADIPFSQFESKTFNKFTWDATLNYQPTEAALLYAKIATGFRSGGYNTYATLAATVATVQPENVRSYEMGAKTEWLDRRLRVNGDIFYYDYTDQQVQSIYGSSAGTKLSNAGASIIKGAELEVEAAPIPAVRLSASVGYTSAIYTTFENSLNGQPINLAGNTLPYAPRFTASVLGSYTWKWGNERAFTAETSWSYRDTVFFDPFNEPYTSAGPLFLGAVRFTLDVSPKTSIYLYSENVGNRNYVSFAYFDAGLNASQTYGDRRTIGLGLRHRF